MLCAGANFCLLTTFFSGGNGGKDACQGDSGGPLVFMVFINPFDDSNDSGFITPLIRKLFIGPKSHHCLVLLVTLLVLLLSFAQIVGFFKVVRWISLSLDLSILVHGFLSVVIWIYHK